MTDTDRLEYILSGDIEVCEMGTTTKYLNFITRNGYLSTTADGDKPREALDEAIGVLISERQVSRT